MNWQNECQRLLQDSRPCLLVVAGTDNKYRHNGILSGKNNALGSCMDVWS